MEEFIGKWKSEESEGFEDYLKALGEFILRIQKLNETRFAMLY